MSTRPDIDVIAALLAGKPRPRTMTRAQRRAHKQARDRRSARKRYWLQKAGEGVSGWISPAMMRFLRASGLWREGVTLEEALDSLRSYCIALEAFVAAYDARENRRETGPRLVAGARARIRA